MSVKLMKAKNITSSVSNRDLRALQLREHPIQHTIPGPAVHLRIDRMPPGEPLGQSPPLATVLGDIQDRV